MAILLEYEADKLNGQTITYVDDGEDISEVFGPVYTWVHYGVFVVRLSPSFHNSNNYRPALQS